MRTLMLTKPVMTGEDVRRWQKFLISRGINLGNSGPDHDGADGFYGNATDIGTKIWQERAEDPSRGVVGETTIALARKYKFDPDSQTGLVAGATPLPPPAQKPTFTPQTLAQNDPSWPEKTFKYLDGVDRSRIFGDFSFTPRPGSSDAGGDIQILGGWENENITSVSIPQMAGKPYYDEGSKLKCDGHMRFHKKAAGQLQGLFKAWEDAGLMNRVLTFDGAFNPRYIRGSKVNLSNHSWGTAFDINANWNGLNKTPARLSEKGCVRELVEIAHKFGFFWGGNFEARKDGMHFEVAFLI